MKKQNTKTLFDTLYKDISGHKISKAARDKLSHFYFGHTYGEVTYDGFSAALKKATPKKGEIFYDLGSGVGKAVVLSSLLYDFSKLVGVEIIRELNDAALVVHSKLKQHAENDTNLKLKVDSMQFFNNDFAEIDFADADIIYINATCLEYELNNALINRLNTLKPGTRIITNSIAVTSPIYKITYQGIHPFSWGGDVVFVQERTDDFGYFSS